MSDTTIRRIVWYALLTALFIQPFGLKAQTPAPLYMGGGSYTSFCTGTMEQICHCNGMDYDPHAKPVPGCVVRNKWMIEKCASFGMAYDGTSNSNGCNGPLPAAPEPQAKPPENIATPQPFELQAAHDPCGLPAALHERDGRCHVIMSCEGRYARATVKLVKGVWKLDCSWKPQR